jgi:hypothetical protein
LAVLGERDQQIVHTVDPAADDVDDVDEGHIIIIIIIIIITQDYTADKAIGPGEL